MNLPTINCATSACNMRRKREGERSVNWTAEETHVLLCAWSDQRVQKSLSENLRNRHVFKHLSARMSDMGFSRSPHQCRLRVKTLKANYARAKLQRSSDSSQMCTFKYFDEMDAVLGRSADSSRGDPRFRAPVAELGDHILSSLGREHLSSSDEKGSHPPWPLYLHVKMENGEDSEFSDAGFQESPQERQQDLDLGATVLPPPAAPPLEVASSPPPASVVANPAAADDGAGAAARHVDDSRLEPALQHLAHCYQQLLSETRALLAQLEKQRQEQATWHQELLSQWLQRQREAAEREERREKAHMEHQIQVLELLTCLVREQVCKCPGGGGGITTTTSARAAEVSSELHHIFTKGEN